MIEGRLGTFQQKCLDYVREHPRCTQTAIVEHLNCDKGQWREFISTRTKAALAAAKARAVKLGGARPNNQARHDAKLFHSQYPHFV